MSNPIPHPLLQAVRACAVAFDDVAGVDPLYADEATREALLVELTRLATRVSAARAQVLAVSGDLADRHGARTAAQVLSAATHISRREAAADERLGVAVRDRWTQVGDAARSGAVTWEQASVLVHALDALPGDLDPEVTRKAEAHLVAEAGHFTPRLLRRLGRHVHEVVAPDVADAHEYAALLADEHRARAVTRLTFRPRGDGSTDLWARLPDHVASRLRAYLDSFTSPRRIRFDGSGDVDLLPLPRRRGEAFCTLLEHTPAHRLPRHGGTATSVMVLIDADTLRDRLDTGTGVAETSTGDQITAGEARRLACNARIIPVVLGGASEVLDLGRTRRLFTTPQRKALAVRDRHCRAERYEFPAAWCEAHHTHPWSHGGRTDLKDAALLCSCHHHRTHDPGWHTTRLPDGTFRYHRRT